MYIYFSWNRHNALCIERAELARVCTLVIALDILKKCTLHPFAFNRGNLGNREYENQHRQHRMGTRRSWPARSYYSLWHFQCLAKFANLLLFSILVIPASSLGRTHAYIINISINKHHARRHFSKPITTRSVGMFRFFLRHLRSTFVLVSVGSLGLVGLLTFALGLEFGTHADASARQPIIRSLETCWAGSREQLLTHLAAISSPQGFQVFTLLFASRFFV